MRARTYVLRRFAESTLSLLVIATLNFLLFRLLPGDPVRKLFRDPRITQEQMRQLAAIFGLDKSPWEQYWLYLINLGHGNLGLSFTYKRPVLEVLADPLMATVLLMVVANVLAVALGIWVGMWAARRRGGVADIAGTALSLILWSVPTFWFAMIAVVLFSGTLPISGMVSLTVSHATRWDYIADVVRHMILPVGVLTLGLFGQYSLIMRNSLVGVLTEDYILTARAKGFSMREVMRRYALPNAMLPMVTLVAVNLGFAVAGALQAEIIFTWPGIGTLIYQSVLNRDYPVLQGAFLIIAAAVLAANFLADVLYAYLDPRVKY